MKYTRIVAEFYSRVWALKEETLMSMQDLIRQQAAGVKWSLAEIRERIAAANAANGYLGHENMEARFLAFDDEPMPMQNASGKRNAASKGSVAVIPMTGIISHRMSMMQEISGAGGGSTQALTAQFRQALEDGNCKAIVFDVDSPGGSVEGVMELAQEIYDARKLKPISAVCNAMACSAAYWLASAASEVVCTPSGQCGSIGVYMMLQDESEALKNEGIKITILKAGKYKAEGHPAEPLSDDARNFLQSQVDSVYGMFVKAVAQQRGVSQAAVREGMGQGRSLLANDAVKANLADRTGTLDDVLEKYGVKKTAGARAETQPSAVSRQPSAKKQEDEDEEDEARAEACSACKSCSASSFCGCKDGDIDCGCTCQSCKSCAGRGGAHAHAAAPTNPSEDEARAKACKACKACSAASFCGCRAGMTDDSAACACSCAPCGDCAGGGPKGAAAKRETAAAAGDYLSAIARRRRQMHLL
jgi:signal peptide peptidase SppA